jgi:hypothetical protein
MIDIDDKLVAIRQRNDQLIVWHKMRSLGPEKGDEGLQLSPPNKGVRLKTRNHRQSSA